VGFKLTGCSGKTKETEEGARGLLVMGSDGALFVPSYREVLDDVAVVGHILRAVDRRIGALGRDSGPCAQVPEAGASHHKPGSGP
jgi:hypothetical protein